MVGLPQRLQWTRSQGAVVTQLPDLRSVVGRRNGAGAMMNWLNGTKNLLLAR